MAVHTLNHIPYMCRYACASVGVRAHRKLSIHTPVHAQPPAQISVFKGPPVHICVCPKAAGSCRSGDPLPQEGTRRLSGDATPTEPLAGSTPGPRAERNGWVFFHQINPPPIPAHGNLAPEQVCVMPGGGPSTSHHICSPELKSSLLLPNLQPPPWETLAVVYLKQPQPAVPKGGRGKLWLLFLNMGFFLSSQGFKGFVILPLGFASNHGGHSGCEHGFIDHGFISLWEASQTCRVETRLQKGYSGISCEVSVLPPRLRLSLAIHFHAWCVKNGHNPKFPSEGSSKDFNSKHFFLLLLAYLNIF